MVEGLARVGSRAAPDGARPPAAGALHPAEPRLRAEGLAVGHGRRILVDEVNLELVSSDVAHLVGPNGSGKSSLIRVLAGLDARASGRLKAFGRCAFVAEKVALAPTITVGTWLEAMRRMREGPTVEWQSELARSGLDPSAVNLAASQLSKGMAQRVALVEALAGPAELVFLDEPFSGLDDAGRRWLCDAITRTIQDGRTFLLTDHSGTAASQLAITHHLLLRDRRIERLADVPPVPDSSTVIHVTARDASGARREFDAEPADSDGLLADLITRGHHIIEVHEK